MNINELIWGAVGFLLTVMILSYLIGDNFFFRLAVHVFIGLTGGYLAVLIINQILIPQLMTPLITGSWPEKAWFIVPVLMITLLLLSQIPRFKTIGNIPLAYLLGLTAALAIGGAVFGTLIPQSRAVIAAFDPGRWAVDPENSWFSILDASIMLIGTVSTLSYFHFGRKRNPKNDQEVAPPPMIFKTLSKIGQIFIGITLGAVFAGLFSTSLVALIDRIVFIGQFVAQFFGGG
ncbi:MAG: hypothetical protein U9R53_00655 [Chloroflexota bacterium]|nr:hypothetical protein [Chloroflexota bacterium]